MMKVNVGYPDFEAEKKILELSKSPLSSLKPNLTTDDLLQIQKCVDEIYVDDKLKELIVRIVSATRPGSDEFVKEFEGGILAGASPRASIWLQRVGKFIAYMDGKDYVSPEHLMRIVPDVLGHRIIMTYEAEIDGISGRDAAIKIASKVI